MRASCRVYGVTVLALDSEVMVCRPSETESRLLHRQMEEAARFVQPAARDVVGVPIYQPVSVDAAIAQLKESSHPPADAGSGPETSPRVFLDDILNGLQGSGSSQILSARTPHVQSAITLPTTMSATMFDSPSGVFEQPSFDSLASANTRGTNARRPRVNSEGAAAADDVFFLKALLRVAGRPSDDELRRAPAVPDNYDMYVDNGMQPLGTWNLHIVSLLRHGPAMPWPLCSTHFPRKIKHRWLPTSAMGTTPTPHES